MTLLCVPIMVDTAEQAIATATRAAEAGADIIELRVDRFADQADQMPDLIERCPLPTIVTCRYYWEGGEYEGTEDDRIALLRAACSGSQTPAYIDCELEAYQNNPELREALAALVERPGQTEDVSTRLILSAHDFDGRPSDLHKRLSAMNSFEDCRVLKLAWKARSLRDNLETFELQQENFAPTIALCMGEHGLASRVLAKKFKALLTFAAIDSGLGTAPGQPTIKQLKDEYRWDTLGPQTEVFGVIGDPVGHSMSPAIHNAGFAAINHDAVYLPMPVAPSYESFKATVISWLDMHGLHFNGASVTIPHKENLLRFVREQGGEIEPLSEVIGAANTLHRRPNGQLYACNTDFAAALDAVCSSINIERAELNGKTVAVIGAGGAARAVVAGFAHYGAKVEIYNRTEAKAQELAHEFSDRMTLSPGLITAKPMKDLPESRADVYVNCTPIGMHPNVDASPLPGGARHAWGPGVVVFDTIYNPVETQLLREAKAAGCHTVSGVDMFVRQGAAQFELWTGHAAPEPVFRDVLMQKLFGKG